MIVISHRPRRMRLSHLQAFNENFGVAIAYLAKRGQFVVFSVPSDEPKHIHSSDHSSDGATPLELDRQKLICECLRLFAEV